ncbi:hypothetical protein Vadar_026202 [Vaccinium darrowii]|uniref:Uncharacterized protein n=1 Tax=Vaccinium darrowii TaxID=229202 RepID=A0ACB7XT32_9ERIC|nr:hypothetical protein Vadar_026202 [Vaccinium darrowii]
MTPGFSFEDFCMPEDLCLWEETSVERETSKVSLDELMLLSQLTTLHIFIKDPRILPKGDFFFENLVRFNIGIGRPGGLHDEVLDGALTLQNAHVENALEYLLGKPQHKQSIERNGLHPMMSFYHLVELCVTNCRFKYLCSPSSVRGLVRLHKLMITRCAVMEGVTGTDGEKDEDILIKFSGLKSLILEDLPKLISFYPKMEKTATSSESSFARAQMESSMISRWRSYQGAPGKYLFGVTLSKSKRFTSVTLIALGLHASYRQWRRHSVTFPALEELRIVSVPEITEIWNKQILSIPETATESSFCQLLTMEITGCPKLMNVVRGCPKIEAIEMEKQKGKVVDDYVTCFPKLVTLGLNNLLNLGSFCSSSVAFPALERLHISDFPNIIDIWDKKICTAQSFCSLSDFSVHRCGKLENVVPSNMLPKLQNLETLDLNLGPMVEGVIELERKEEETQGARNNTIVPFPELRFLSLRGLQNVKGFCVFRSEEQRVFNAQVALPKLDHLCFKEFGERTLWQQMDASELSLKRLDFYKCDIVSTVVSPHLLRSLRLVEELNVLYCDGAREVFHFDEQEAGEGQVCVGSLHLFFLPQLTCLWNKDPHGLLVLQNLEYLSIEKCSMLANLLTASVAKALGGLKKLHLCHCSTIEQVIAMDDGHGDAIDDGEIEFPKLENLILDDLPNLKSFCSSNHNLNFPSLKEVVLKSCPKLQTFTSGLGERRPSPRNPPPPPPATPPASLSTSTSTSGNEHTITENAAKVSVYLLVSTRVPTSEIPLEQVNQLLQVAQKCQNTIAESGSDGVSQQDLQSNSNMSFKRFRKKAALALTSYQNMMMRQNSMNSNSNSIQQEVSSSFNSPNQNPSPLTFQSSNYAKFTEPPTAASKEPDIRQQMIQQLLQDMSNNSGGANANGNVTRWIRVWKQCFSRSTAATVNAVKNSASPTPSRSNRFKAASNRDSSVVGGNNGFNQKTTNLPQNFHLLEVMNLDIGHEFPENGFFSSDLDDYGFNWKG